MSSNALIGIAGVHYVAAELSRRGLVALPTVRNTSAYDIVTVTPDGSRHANLQVKASSKRVTFFPMPKSENIRRGRLDYYVLVRWIEKEQRYEGFMLTGKQAYEEVRRGEKFQARRVKKGTRKFTMSSIYVGAKVVDRAKKWKRKWERWGL